MITTATPSTLTSTLFASLLLWSAGIATSIAAMPISPVVGFVSSEHGSALYEHSPGYDAATGRMKVTGAIDGIPFTSFQNGRYEVWINGVVQAVVTQSLGGVEFKAWIPVSEWKLWIMRDLMVEVIDPGNEHVLARDAISFYDLRVDGTPPNAVGIEPFRVDKRAPDAIGLQLTETGIGNLGVQDRISALEIVHQSSLPGPDLTTFNTLLTQAAVDLGTRDDTEDTVCFNIEDASVTEFSSPVDFPALQVALAQAQAIHDAYVAGVDTLSTAALGLDAVVPGAGSLLSLTIDIAANAACSEQEPSVEKFKVCVSRIRSSVSSLETAGVGALQLAFTSAVAGAAGVESKLTLDAIDAAIDVQLRDLSVRWKDAACIAVFAPVPVRDSAIETTDWLNEWASCPALRVQGEATNLYPAEFRIERDAVDPERLDVARSQTGLMTLEHTTRQSNLGTCVEAWLNPSIETILQAYELDIEAIIDDTWQAGTQYSMAQAAAMDAMLTPFEVGVATYPLYDLQADLADPYSIEGEGLGLRWETSTEPKTLTGLTPETWFYVPNRYLPWSETGRTESDVMLDQSYSITTGYLNLVLHAQTGHALNFNFEPSWDELAGLGVTPSSLGVSGNEPPVVDGVLLDQLFPGAGFAQLGQTPLQIRVRHSLAPLTWMAPDLSAAAIEPGLGFPLAYGVSHLEIDVSEMPVIDPAGGTASSATRWLGLRLGFADTHFNLTMSAVDRINKLVPSYDNGNWSIDVVSNQLGACPMYSHRATAIGPSCERQLESAFLALIQPPLSDILLAMLADIPAPRFYNADGLAGDELHAIQINRMQRNQIITFFADIPDF